MQSHKFIFIYKIKIYSGKDPGVGNVMGGRPESDMTEERIVHILNEASSYIKPQSKGESPSNEDSQSPNHPQVIFNITHLFFYLCT